MGRSEKSQGLAPPGVRKDVRAKQARHMINKVVPAILATNARARKGADGSELFVDPAPVQFAVAEAVKEKKKEAEEEGLGYLKRKGQGKRKIKADDNEITASSGVQAPGFGEKNRSGKGRRNRKDSIDEDFADLAIAKREDGNATLHKTRIRIIATDTLTAAHMLPAAKKNKTNTCILNFASPLRPGGGILTGATSQEEFLCARTTLLPSLKESFYRLPEVGGIYTHDVLVFRDSTSSLGEHSGDLGPLDRYWVDVISAAMLRFPELEGKDDDRRLGKKDREAVEAKMRGVLRIAGMKGVRRIVLGAWGCGAYGNPVGDIARAWRRVLDGVNESENWGAIEDVVFAIANKNMARDFAKAFGGDIEVESGPAGAAEEEEEEDENAIAREELRAKIKEMEGQLAQVWNPELKARMGTIMDGLRAQLAARNEEEGEDESEDSE